MHIYPGIILLLLAFSYISPANPQDSTEKEKGIFKILADDFMLGLGDAEFVLNEIITLERNGFLILGATAGGTALLMPVDDNIHFYIEDNLQVNHDILQAFDYYSEIDYIQFSAVGLYLAGLFSGDEYLRTSGRMMAEALLLSGGLTMAGRFITGRTRPYYTADQYEFNWLGFGDLLPSFPSGHSTVAFALSTIAADRIDTWWSYPLFMTLASASTLSRLYGSHHWASDLFLGGAIGYLSARVIIKANESREQEIESSYSFYPVFGGIGFCYKF